MSEKEIIFSAKEITKNFSGTRASSWMSTRVRSSASSAKTARANPPC